MLYGHFVERELERVYLQLHELDYNLQSAKYKIQDKSNRHISYIMYEYEYEYEYLYFKTYSGTSLLRSPTGLGKGDFNGEVTLLQGVICTVEYNLGLNQGDCHGEVFLLQ